MPEIGPDGLYRYLPHEAYNAMGHHLYQRDWHDTYSGVLLPHSPAAIGEAVSENYHQRQNLTAHEQITLGRLLEALKLGKTYGWQLDGGDQWSRISYSDWQSGSYFCGRLEAEIKGCLKDHEAPSRTLWIESQRLDEFIAGQLIPEIGSYQPKINRRPRGREGFNWDAFKTEFRRMEDAAELPSIETGWRTTVAEHLLTFGNDTLRLAKLPKRETILDRMKDTFDEYEAEELTR